MAVIYDDFRGSHVIVTGAAAGIGRAIAIAYAQQGAIVTAIDINEAGLAETAEQAEGYVVSQPCDVTDLGGLRNVADAAISAHGPVKVLVNNAGVDRRIAFDQLSAEDWQRMMALNLDHYAVLSSAVSEQMDTASGHAAIVNLSSSAWMKLAGNLAAYHAAKAGIIGLTRGLARDLGGKGVSVNAIAPGRVLTERVADDVDEAWYDETRQIQCVPDLIKPNDIAEAALWLGSSDARFVTGQTLIVDGGVV
ncbi:SDR family oxidoreductase [Cognatishimia sp. WU-CL00825]|uniref:SDR family NAD(P)-dependent oxidoreductase n=1 Tax=Cognatishimia sp. WU-CL00825 TaxID=3127658 RepID=UPI0031037B84